MSQSYISSNPNYQTDSSAQESVELIIPSFLQDSLGCFKRSNTGDVSHLFNITLKSSQNETLFVDNESDLRDALKQYVMYRNLCDKIEQEMQQMQLTDVTGSSHQKSKKDSKIAEKKSSKTVKETKSSKVEFVRRPPDSFNSSSTAFDQTRRSVSSCSHNCKRVSKISFETQTDPKSESQKAQSNSKDKKCCNVM